MFQNVQQLINDARMCQKSGNYELAIHFLGEAEKEDISKKNGVEIQKLLCYNYRKMEEYSHALYHISLALNCISKSKYVNYSEAETERAVCLMNKGVVFEEMQKYDSALKCYETAIRVFTKLHNNNAEEYGIIINAYLTLANLQIKRKQKKQAENALLAALGYFGEDKENDRRYIAARKTLKELDLLFPMEVIE